MSEESVPTPHTRTSQRSGECRNAAHNGFRHGDAGREHVAHTRSRVRPVLYPALRCVVPRCCSSPLPSPRRASLFSPSLTPRCRSIPCSFLPARVRCSQVQDIEVEEMVIESVPLDPMTALKIVLRTSMFHDGLARGLHEAVKGQCDVATTPRHRSAAKAVAPFALRRSFALFSVIVCRSPCSARSS
jgi:hypothetical protein